MLENNFFSSLILSNKYHLHNRNGFLKLMSLVNITGWPIVFNTAINTVAKLSLGYIMTPACPLGCRKYNVFKYFIWISFCRKGNIEHYTEILQCFRRKRYKNTKSQAQQHM